MPASPFMNYPPAPAEPAPIIGAKDLQQTPSAYKLQDMEAQLGLMLTTLTMPSNLAARVETLYVERRQRRMPIEREWLDGYARYNNTYTGEIASRMAATPNRSHLWVGLTRWKVDSAHTDIMDVMRSPGSGDPWDLEPWKLSDQFPMPEELLMQGFTVASARDQLKKAAEALKVEISNQLNDCDWHEATDRGVLEMCITGSMCHKGPITVRNRKPKWKAEFDANADIALYRDLDSEFRPDVRWVPIQHAYPNMEWPNIQETDFIEECPMPRRKFMELVEQPGINPAGIMRVLRETPTGNYEPQPFDLELRRISGDSEPTDSGLFRVLIFQGEVLGRELRDAGATVPEDLLNVSLRAEVMTCGRYVLSMRPIDAINYYVTPYRRRAAQSPLGVGVPKLIEKSQDAINGAARMIMDNAAIASGPMFELNTRLLSTSPGSDPTDIHGWKVVLSDHDGHSGKRAWFIHTIPAVTDLFMHIIDKFMYIADLESTQARQSHGVQGPGTTRTATGMSILQSNEQKKRNQTMLYIDDHYLEPLIEQMVDWNFLYNPKQEIRVPVQVMARGSHALLAREIQSQRLLQAYQIFMGNPRLREDEALKEFFKTMGLAADKFVYTDEDMVAMGMPPMGPAQLPPIGGAGAQRAQMANQMNNGGPQVMGEGGPPQGLPQDSLGGTDASRQGNF